MNADIMVIAGLVAVFALGEMTLPRVFSALCRKFRRPAAVPPDPAPAEASQDAVPVAPALASDRPVRPQTDGAPQPPADSGRQEDETRSQSDAPGRDVPDGDGRSADLIWDEARVMPHNFIPDPQHDAEYLAKVFEAAQLGHPEAMLKLGDYASRRGAIIEAYYWLALADLKGVKGLKKTLLGVRSRWLMMGRPAQFGNVYEGFSAEKGEFSRTLLCIRSSVNPAAAHQRMRELAGNGCDEARLFLESGRPEASHP